MKGSNALEEQSFLGFALKSKLFLQPPFDPVTSFVKVAPTLLIFCCKGGAPELTSYLR